MSDEAVGHGRSPAEVATAFYDAFARKDPDTMAGLYADTATFEDPVFGRLDAPQTRAMWRMLLGRAPDLTASHQILEYDLSSVRVAWSADYVFTATKRPVHNEIEARMVVADGQIVEHSDSFSFWTWSKQALGPVGVVAGWTPMLRAKVRRQALDGLSRSK